jgi:hypothetical protein
VTSFFQQILDILESQAQSKKPEEPFGTQVQSKKPEEGEAPTSALS